MEGSHDQSCISYLLPCKKWPPMFSDLYTYYHTVSVGQESECNSDGCLWLKVLMLQSRCWLGLSLIWSIDGEGSTSKITHIVVNRIQLLQFVRLRTSVPHWLSPEPSLHSLSCQLPRVADNTAAGFSQSRWGREPGRTPRTTVFW